eukprot:TRINITY_DN17234_c1_g1_i4.p5 TRINITY_DN17234_c1_g1~~TRINITY_DN17234_c1_g1_i4.p5  ORF type:complete len:124 (-),score=20.81 TRINITY_DN17234_c1_g1_i4:436-807(-)
MELINQSYSIVVIVRFTTIQNGAFLSASRVIGGHVRECEIKSRYGGDLKRAFGSVELQEAMQESAKLRADMAAIQKERLEAQRALRRMREEEELLRAQAMKSKLELKQTLGQAAEILSSNNLQ